MLAPMELRSIERSKNWEASVSFCCRRMKAGTAILCSPALTSFPVLDDQFKAKRTAIDTHHWHYAQGRDPSQGLVLLHIYVCKSGPTATLLSSEISNLGINKDSCKFLWILTRRGMSTQKDVYVETFLPVKLKNTYFCLEDLPPSHFTPLWSETVQGFLREELHGAL